MRTKILILAFLIGIVLIYGGIFNKEKEEIEKETIEEIINTYTNKMEDLKSSFETKLVNLIEEAKAEYYSYPEEERESKKMSLGLKYLRRANELEGMCDVEVDRILREFKKKLKDNDYDTHVVLEVKNAYDKEKSEKRKELLQKALNME
ncbi:hypothetical protein [Anaeromicrobium sediminis]|uniref:Uncharacterized protein n=1 Tax=Anaeromicrobium sediminis TaxID=1478221 RepID=A0A267MKQ2_9FIRM|nr:hypothetical protein [Anaeromicrobium sediminis]PAB59383.1 hypothetical protein CCE28_11025 [Anaeromicrobium sediminis]